MYKGYENIVGSIFMERKRKRHDIHEYTNKKINLSLSYRITRSLSTS
ncbi:24601_t:CDS:1, partial [Dentiscutata erythropus]